MAGGSRGRHRRVRRANCFAGDAPRTVSSLHTFRPISRASSLTFTKSSAPVTSTRCFRYIYILPLSSCCSQIFLLVIRKRKKFLKSERNSWEKILGLAWLNSRDSHFFLFFSLWCIVSFILYLFRLKYTIF